MIDVESWQDDFGHDALIIRRNGANSLVILDDLSTHRFMDYKSACTFLEKNNYFVVID